MVEDIAYCSLNPSAKRWIGPRLAAAASGMSGNRQTMHACTRRRGRDSALSSRPLRLQQHAQRGWGDLAGDGNETNIAPLGCVSIEQPFHDVSTNKASISQTLKDGTEVHVRS